MDRRALPPMMAVALLAAFGVAYLAASKSPQDSGERLAALMRSNSKDVITDYIIENIDTANIRSHLRNLTKVPHIGGTEAELRTAEYVVDAWTTQGYDDVNMVPYDVLLSYPDDEIPNMVRLLNTDDSTVIWESQPKQKPLYAPEESLSEVPYNFNGYSAPGNVTGSLVYVHYGREEDFAYLEAEGVNISGRIVMARYGQIFRANTANFAEERGAIGVIFFSDPSDYAPHGYDAVYPDTILMPPSAVPLGSVKLVDGDPLTPYYPAIESAFHIPIEEAAVPKIPCQPISYEDAWTLLTNLGGASGPAEWQGGLNITYNVGPTPEDRAVNLDVLTNYKRTKIYNVIAVLRGSIEPDRYVILGNHRDAWIFGSIDPSSGTAAMLELSRLFMQAYNETGWRPRRSLVFCSWAAEEYGLLGSQEWTEQFGKQLQDRAVAYLNVDMALEGNYTLRTKSAPLLYDIVYNATKLIPNPDQAEVEAGRPTVFDTWLARRPDPDHPDMPLMQFIGSGSDYKGLQHNLGVPSLDIRFTNDNETLGEPLYHTLYETFSLVDELYDRDFLFHKAITALWGEIAVRLADEKILPLSLVAYSDFINEAQVDLNDQFGDMIRSRNLTLDHFLEAGSKFDGAVKKFEAALPFLDTNNELALRRINDQIQLVERSLIDPRGLPGRPDYNHVVFAPSEKDAYSGTAFCGLTDALTTIAENPDADDVATTWRRFEEHLAAVTHLLNTAGAVLSDKLW